MESIATIKLNLVEKLRKESYFQKFFAERAKDELATQIRLIREDVRKLTQAEFAAECGMKQSAVSRIEDADYSAWNFKTLLRVAKGLKARLVIRFELMEDVINRYESRENIVTVISNETGAYQVKSFNVASGGIGIPQQFHWVGANSIGPSIATWEDL